MRRYAMAVLSVALVAGCASLPTAKDPLQSGDVVEVRFTGIPQPQTHTCTISPGGSIALPHVGDVAAAGRTPTELEIEIKKAYSSGWIKSFDVTVSRVDRQ